MLAATVDSLVELGFHRTTTYSVEQRAGVTRGALLHHFASKNALFIATAEYIVHAAETQLVVDVNDTAAAESRGDLTELLWKQFRSPTFVAFLEMVVAARTDTALRAELCDLQQRLDTYCRQAVARLAGTDADNARFATGLDLTINFMRGAVVGRMLGERPKAEDELQRQWRLLIAPYLSSGALTS